MSISAGGPTSIPVYLDGINGDQDVPPTTLDNLFFCIGSRTKDDAHDVCNYYSSVFNLGIMQNGTEVPGLAASSVSFSSTLTITATSTQPGLQIHGATITSTGPISDPTASSSGLSTTGTTSTTVTLTPTASVAPAASIVQHSSSSLSTGAKVGIALGSLAFVCLLLLAALFCLRKKHAKRGRSQPEQAMLTRDMHTDSFSRNLMMMEKDRGIGPTSSIAQTHEHDPALDTPLETSPSTSLPIQRHSALSPYEPVPSAPYNGPVGAAAVPRRKPTATKMINTVSRGLSTNSRSTAGPISPRSISATAVSARSEETPSPPEAFEAYHDVPIYGDARHVPQVFSGVDRGERGVVGGSASPFLEETEGMSPEEVARLEEEERRIDAAIAAAEGR
ncbi:hypothetical protein EG329_010754 [Mollisiaceae sp. DMI_Dod_QoI]|nr:hypothetical protein EG329_010754 [Helotiales sp. DMI_Dod_QoI]